MFLQLIKIYARLAIKIYCIKVVVNKPDVLQSSGPLLLAANHPNSFLDGIILTTLFNNPIYALARGDAFNNPVANKILRWLRQLPVYRTREGADKLNHNYTTFAACRKVFEKDGIVLIFSEAFSYNQWHLRPLRKGTARLAISSWQQGIDVTVIPVALNYSSFKRFGKVVHIYFGQPITAPQVMHQTTEGKQLLTFNAHLKTELQQYVYEIKEGDKQTVLKKFDPQVNTAQKAALLLPAIFGFITHAILFYTIQLITKAFFNKSEHYDSVLTALLLITYPIYLIAIFIYLTTMHIGFALLAILSLPFSAWAFIKFRGI